jgi:hypothetical protein
MEKKMNSNMKSKIFFVLVFLLLSACSKSATENIDVAVEKHISAVGSVEATTACTEAFQKSVHISSAEFCEALLKRTDAEFSICEADIRNPKFSDLIKDCEPELLNRLIKIEEIRNEGLAFHANVFSTGSLGLGFKISADVQYRDLSS